MRTPTQTAATSWMHFPVWALWMESVRYELDRMLHDREDAPLRSALQGLNTHGYHFSFCEDARTWLEDKQGAPINESVATLFTIKDDLVILETDDPHSVKWNRLQGMLGVFGVPMNHRKEGVLRNYRYENPNVEQVHHVVRDAHKPCIDLSVYCVRGDAAILYALCLATNQQSDLKDVLTHNEGILARLTSEQSKRLLRSSVFHGQSDGRTISTLADAGLCVPFGARVWLENEVDVYEKTQMRKPSHYVENMGMIAALEARASMRAAVEALSIKKNATQS